MQLMMKTQTLNIVENTACRTQHQGNIDLKRPTHLVIQIGTNREADESENKIHWKTALHITTTTTSWKDQKIIENYSNFIAF